MDDLFLIGIPLGFCLGYFYMLAKMERRYDEAVTARLEKREKALEKEVRLEFQVAHKDAVYEEMRIKIRDEIEPKMLAEAEALGKEVLLKSKQESEEIKSQATVLLDKAHLALNQAQQEARQMIQEAQKEAKTFHNTMKADLDLRVKKLDLREDKIESRERKMERDHERINEKEYDLNLRWRNIETLQKQTEQALEDAKVAQREASQTLQSVASMTPAQAKEAVLEAARETHAAEISVELKAQEVELQERADKEAQRILAIAVQRWAGSYIVERGVYVVQLPDDEIKGKIIGREGRNIRAFEQITGTDIIVDDTPDAIAISAFNPVRREVARLAMEKLVADGRIHPTRIEEVVRKTEEELEDTMMEDGKLAAFELGIYNLHPELIRLLGQLKYRTSYGQNMWTHSIEVGFLCGLMAAELGLDEHLARRSGLLHDIGKALTHEKSGPHALVGAEIAKRCGECELVRNAIAAHHDEEPQESAIAHLVIAADALSGARPGARREVLTSYIQRVEQLETVAKGFDGVDQAYAIQAGREVRVVVAHEKVDDLQAQVLARRIAHKIEADLMYPGHVKVCVIRESRAVEYAK